MNEMIKVLLKSAIDMISLLNCDNIVPIYQTTFYDATCQHSIKAVIWMFSSSLIMAFFGFVMIMFRSSMSETIYTYRYDSSYGRSSSQIAQDQQDLRASAFHDENDAETKAGQTTIGPGDSVMHSIENYEKNHMKGSP
jgi:hypothetical protein